MHVPRQLLCYLAITVAFWVYMPQAFLSCRPKHMFAWSANRSVCNRHHLKLPSFLSRFRLAKHNDVEIVLIFLLELKRLEQLWYKIWLAGISYADNSVC